MELLIRINTLLSPLFSAPPTIRQGELTVSVSRDSILLLIRILRDHTPFQFSSLVDLTCVDYYDSQAYALSVRLTRFQLVYQLLSYRFNCRISIRVDVEDGAVVPSVSGEFPSAAWAEREVWDLFGVPFSGNPDLRRILTDYGFEGHPLRKDFPLSGFYEVRYDDQLHRIISEPVQFSQRPRDFQPDSVWSIDSDSTFWVDNPPPPPLPEDKEETNNDDDNDNH